MKLLIITLLFLGILMSVVGYYQGNTTCPKPKVIYRYLDKTLEESQKGDQVSVYNEFLDMFLNPPVLI